MGIMTIAGKVISENVIVFQFCNMVTDLANSIKARNKVSESNKLLNYIFIYSVWFTIRNAVTESELRQKGAGQLVDMFSYHIDNPTAVANAMVTNWYVREFLESFDKDGIVLKALRIIVYQSTWRSKPSEDLDLIIFVNYPIMTKVLILMCYVSYLRKNIPQIAEALGKEVIDMASLAYTFDTLSVAVKCCERKDIEKEYEICQKEFNRYIRENDQANIPVFKY